MEVAMAEEKKKIFRARKTMKISDRQQLETLHGTLLSAAQSPTPSPPPAAPVVNGTHKEEGRKGADKEQNDFLDSNSSPAHSPVSPASRGSPPPSLSLNLSPSPTSSQSPKTREDTPPASPFQTIDNIDLKNTEDGKKAPLPSPSNGCSAVSPTESKEGPDEEEGKLEKKGKATESEKKEINTTKDDAATAKDSLKPTINDSAPSVKESEEDHRAVTNSAEPMETDGGDTMEAKAPETSASTIKDVKTPSSKAGTSTVPAPSSSSQPQAATVLDQEKETKEAAKEVKVEKIKDEVTASKEKVKKGPTGPTKEIKMEVDHVKAKTEVGESSKPSRPTSTPPSDTVVKVEKNTSSQLKRTLSEGEKDGPKVEREGKRPKVELEAQLELKITGKANSRLKLEKLVQQLVAEQLKMFECTVIDKGLQELKDRVEKIDCATKHQTGITTLQAKITRIAKKFGEANQASENRRKQEAAAKTAAAAVAAAAAAAGPATQITPVTHRLVRATTQTPPTSISSTNATSTARLGTSVSVSMATPTSTTMVQQTPQILQLITSSSNATNSLGGGINTQSSMGTLLLKTANGSPMMAGGQPLLIQLPMSMNNCPPGTLVNIPVSSLPTVNSLNKAKTATTTTTFILKQAHAITTAASVTSTVPAIQQATAQMTQMSQMSLARAVYQGGAGGISTPSAGVSVTTARAPTQSISVAGAMTSSSSPATSGPAATGSAAPGPPQGTSMTSKTDNQATSSTPAKPAVVAGRPKGSVIDLTEDDDDVQVTGVVKNATAAPASATQRPHPVISVPNSAGTRSSPQSTQNSGGNPQTTVHHRAPVESPAKPRVVTTSAPHRNILPPLPAAPQPVGRLPVEAAQTSPPQQPQLKLVPSPSGIVLSWCVAETDLTCATVDSYHLYAFHQDNSNANTATQQHWKKIGEVKALPLPMACTLTQFQAGSTYHFAVRAKDTYGRFGSFCDPQCTNVISPNSG